MPLRVETNFMLDVSVSRAELFQHQQGQYQDQQLRHSNTDDSNNNNNNNNINNNNNNNININININNNNNNNTVELLAGVLSSSLPLAAPIVNFFSSRAVHQYPISECMTCYSLPFFTHTIHGNGIFTYVHLVDFYGTCM